MRRFDLPFLALVLGFCLSLASLQLLDLRRLPVGSEHTSASPEGQIGVLGGLPSISLFPGPAYSQAAASRPQNRAVSSGPVQAHILMYHYVRAGVDPAKDALGYRLSITPESLDAQLTFLQSQGYQMMSMADLAAGKGSAKSLVLTFDDGYEDFYTAAYPILKKHGLSATVYVISGKIGGSYLTWPQIQELQRNGIEIGAHTVDHRDLAVLSPAQQKVEIEQSKKSIEAELGVPVTAFCYPSGKYNDQTVALVKAAGFLTATTTNPGAVHTKDNRLILNRVRISPNLTLPALQKLLQQG